MHKPGKSLKICRKNVRSDSTVMMVIITNALVTRQICDELSGWQRCCSRQLLVRVSRAVSRSARNFKVCLPRYMFHDQYICAIDNNSWDVEVGIKTLCRYEPATSPDYSLHLYCVKLKRRHLTQK